VSPIKAAVAWALGVGDEVALRMRLGVGAVCRVGIGPAGPTLLSFNESVDLERVVSPEMGSATLTIPGIHCDHCKSSIEGALNQLEGVRSAEVSVDERTVAVEYDESAVDLDAIKDAIIEQGYDLPA
jgi:copper chaperone